MTRSSKRCGAITTPPTIAICSRGCASACPTRRWAAISSSVFPARATAQFESSLEYFDDLPLTYFHVFPYSARRGTVATALPDPVPAPEKKLRAQRMRELGARKKQEFCAGFAGRQVTVLVEGKSTRRAGRSAVLAAIICRWRSLAAARSPTAKLPCVWASTATAGCAAASVP